MRTPGSDSNTTTPCLSLGPLLRVSGARDLWPVRAYFHCGYVASRRADRWPIGRFEIARGRPTARQREHVSARHHGARRTAAAIRSVGSRSLSGRLIPVPGGVLANDARDSSSGRSACRATRSDNDEAVVMEPSLQWATRPEARELESTHRFRDHSTSEVARLRHVSTPTLGRSGSGAAHSRDPLQQSSNASRAQISIAA